MKMSLKYVYERYPNVKDKVEGKTKGKEVQLTNTEDAFYQLALFFNDPDGYSFNVAVLYKNLQDDDLSYALQALLYFFRNDTYLIKHKEKISPFLISEHDEIDTEGLYNQTKAADYLQSFGLNYSQSKIATYLSRGGNIPSPDITIRGKPFWYETTLKLFAEEESNREPYQRKHK